MSRLSWSARKSVSSLTALLTVTTAALVASSATSLPGTVDSSGLVLQGNGSSAAATGNNGNGGGNGGGNGTAPKTFTIKGTVTNVVPGVMRNLQLTITNPNNQTISVTKLSAALQSVTKASGAPAGTCSATTLNLTIGTWTGSTFSVPPNAIDYAAPGAIPVGMPGSVAQACIRADFILNYTGTALQP